MKLAPYFKAIVAALIAGASAAIPQIDDGLSASEGLGVAVAFLTALSVVFAVPNKDPEGEHQEESVQPVAVDETDTLALEVEYARIGRILGKA